MRTDEQLVRAIRKGDEAAFDELYDRYSKRLFRYISRFMPDRAAAEDLYQDVFMTVLRDRSFDLRKRGFGGWLFTVARNRCLSHLRSDKRQAEHLEHLGQVPREPLAPSAEELLAVRQQLGAVGTALASLAEPYQDAFVLKQLADLSYREIAEIQGVPEGTVKSRLHAAVRAVQRTLAAQGEA